MDLQASVQYMVVMAQTPEGARKTAAAHLGISLAAYEKRVSRGEKWCTRCQEWHRREAFGSDRSRPDGLTPSCRRSKNAAGREEYVPRPRVGRSGPAPYAPRGGDKLQARQRINVEVRTGRRPHPNELPCTDCGHVWMPGERRHEYDHHLGYAAAHHYDVQPVCTTCHAKRDGVHANATHCKHGHVFTPENTVQRTDHRGRGCLTCRREYDRRRRPRKGTA